MQHNQREALKLKSQLAVLLASWLMFSAGRLVAGQFLQPQSHLGRLVQSITSPLILTSAVSSGATETDPGEGPSFDSESAMSGAPNVDRPQLERGHRDPQPLSQYRPEEAGQHFQHYRRQPHVGVPLQEAPSRGIPQRYYNAHPSADEDEGPGQMSPTGGEPSLRHQQRQQREQQQQPAAAVANEQYQMGAYLGPTIDDKEIQGAFNSNDERDDDDTPGYDGPPRSGAGSLRQDAAAHAYMTSQPLESAGSYGGPRGGQRDRAARPNAPSGGFDDEDESNVDEDDAGEAPHRPTRLPRRFRQSAGMSQTAASHFRDGSQQGRGEPQSASMMAAANGYSPMGSSPFDLSSLMAAAAGAGNGQAFEVYNGDGSYPGYYPQQQQQRQQGRRNQAASMQNPYGYNQMNGNGNHNQQRGATDMDDDDED